MSSVLVITKITRNDNGTIDLEFTKNGVSGNYQFASAEHMVSEALDPVQDNHDAVLALIAFWQTVDPSMSDDALMLNQPIKITGQDA